MSHASDPDHALVTGFFAALEKRHLDECAALLEQLRQLARAQPAYEPWCSYFDGILANERDHDWAAAERIFNRLLPRDFDRSLRGRVLLALGRTYDYQGRWAEAIGAFEGCLPIFAQLGQPLDQVKAWKQIAISYRKGFSRGDFGSEVLQRAIEFCRMALDALEPIADPTPDIAWLKGSVWNTLGLIYRSSGDWDQAVVCYQHDLAICRALDDRHGIGVSLLNLGEIYQKRGRASRPEALDAYQQALDIFQTFNNRYLTIDVLSNLALLHQEIGSHPAALDYYRQAIGLIESLRAGISDEAARAGFFATVTDTYANAVLFCLEAGRATEAFEYVERARSRAFLDLLAARSAELPAVLEAAPMTLAEVQAALPEDALLIEYFTTGLVEAREGLAGPGQAVLRHRFPPARTLIFAVTYDMIQVHDAGLAPNDLRPSQLDSVVERHFLQPAIRRALYDRLLGPVTPLLPGRRRLYLAPHGPLHYIPFQALTAPDRKNLLHAGGPQLIYGPGATFLFRYSRATPGRASEPCLALGYNGAGDQQLHFAEEEARSIARLAGGHALAGPMPKLSTLYDQATHYRLLHLSCHGNFDPEAPLSSALLLAPGEMLTALDVLDRLRLRCDLVTLSACESGLSRVRRGDELSGMVRAFVYAGAPALVCTLWRVDERSTRILMERFYQEIQGGAGFAEALKRAQLYLIGLDRKQAFDILVRCMAGELFGQAGPAPAEPPEALAELAVGQAVDQYLKSVTTRGERAGVEPYRAARDDEHIFADPYYWAAFILIGDHGS